MSTIFSQIGNVLGTEIQIAKDEMNTQIASITTTSTDTQASIDAEETARIDADTALQTSIDLEASTRASADTTLQTNIFTESSIRASAVSSLQTNLATETTTRADADIILQANIALEEAARLDNDTNLQALITTEVANRVDGDSNLLVTLTSVTGRVSSLETLTTSTDLNLDTIQEIVDFIQANRADLESISMDWTAIVNKPTTFPPSAHGHTISEVTDLQTNLDSKLSTAGGDVSGTLNIGTTAGGAESAFQAASTTHAGQPFINVPWVYTHQIEAPDERGTASTGIAIGRDGTHNINPDDDDTVSIYTQGVVRFRVKSDGSTDFSETPTVNGGFVSLDTHGHTEYLGINDNAVSATTANTLDGLDSTQFARTDIDETFDNNITINGNLTINSSAKFNVNDAIYFEGDKHAISYNDGEGNFNIRVGHISTSPTDEVCTEAGYTFHTEWGQSSGVWQQNISQSAAVGESVIWEHTLQFDTTGLSVNGSKVLTEATGSTDIKIVKLLSTSTNQDAQTAHEVTWETTSILDTDTFSKPNTTDITVLVSGRYRVTSNLRYTNTGAARFSTYARVLVNGTAMNETYSKAYSRGSIYGSELTNNINGVFELNASDVLSIQIGKQQADQTTAVNKVGTSCSFIVEKIG